MDMLPFHFAFAIEANVARFRALRLQVTAEGVQGRECFRLGMASAFIRTTQSQVGRVLLVLDELIIGESSSNYLYMAAVVKLRNAGLIEAVEHGSTIFLLFPQLFLMALVPTGGANCVLRLLSHAMIVERDVSRFTA